MSDAQANLHYEARQKFLREKFGIDKLLTSNTFKFSENKPASDSRHFTSRIEYLKAKYGFKEARLQCEGMEKPKEHSLADVEQARGSETEYSILGEGIREPMRFQVVVKLF